MAEVEPEEGPLALRGVEQGLDPGQGDARLGHPVAIGIVSDEVIVVLHDAAVPGEVDEDGLVGRRLGERVPQ